MRDPECDSAQNKQKKLNKSSINHEKKLRETTKNEEKNLTKTRPTKETELHLMIPRNVETRVCHFRVTLYPLHNPVFIPRTFF
jgi:hypothetical protein